MRFGKRGLIVIAGSVLVIGLLSTSGMVFGRDAAANGNCSVPTPVLMTNHGYGSHQGTPRIYSLGDTIEITATIAGCTDPMSAWDWHVQSAGGIDDTVIRTQDPMFSVTLDSFAPFYMYVIPITMEGEPLVHWQNAGAIRPQMAVHDSVTLTPSSPVYEFTAPFACCPRAFSAGMRLGPDNVGLGPDVTVQLLRENGEVLFEGLGSQEVKGARLEEWLGAYWHETLTWRIEADNSLPVGFEILLDVDIETDSSILPAAA